MFIKELNSNDEVTRVVSLKSSIRFSKNPSVGLRSAVISNAKVENTEIAGLVRIAGTLEYREYIEFKLAFIKAFFPFKRIMTDEDVDSRMPEYWPRYFTYRALSFWETIWHFICKGEYVVQHKKYKYDEYFDHKEEIAIVIPVSEIEKIKEYKNQ